MKRVLFYGPCSFFFFVFLLGSRYDATWHIDDGGGEYVYFLLFVAFLIPYSASFVIGHSLCAFRHGQDNDNARHNTSFLPESISLCSLD
jgi:hypothetical protein